MATLPAATAQNRITDEAPEGRPIIAQDEVLGKPPKMELSPVGTAEESEVLRNPERVTEVSKVDKMRASLILHVGKSAAAR